MKLVIAGYYGCGNIGDDALLTGLMTGLGDLPVQVVALSGSPESTQRYVGVRSVPRRDHAAIQRELETADALVFGGGGLLQDATSFFSIKYYAGLIHLAKKMRKRVILLAQGVGPITSFFGKRTSAAAIRLCDAITVRDSGSLQVVKSLGPRVPVEVTADLAWLVLPSSVGDAGFQLGDMKAVAIAARPWGKKKAVAEAFGGFAQLLFKNQYVPVLVEMDRTMDTAVLDAVAKMHGGRCLDMRNVAAPSEMLARLSRMHAVVSMRLHAGIFAASAGIAPMMVAYDPKVAAFASQLGLPQPLPMEALSAQKLWGAFQAFERDRDRLNKQVQLERDSQVKAAQRNIDILLRSLPALTASGKS